MSRKSKKKAQIDNRLKVFGFMRNPHELIVLTETGQEVARIEVESVADAKDKLMRELMNVRIVAATGRNDFTTLWIDDPAGDPAVVEACRLMEEQAATASSPAVPASPESEPDVKPESDTGSTQEIVDSNPDQGEQAAGERTQEQTGAEETGSSESDPQVEERPVAEQKPKKSKELKTQEYLEFEIDDAEAYSYLSKAVQELEHLKNEAAQVQSDYNKDIKDKMKAVFAAARGKALKSVKCRIEYNFTEGIKTWYRTDTGEAVKRLDMTDDERQCGFADELMETVKKPEEPAEATTEPPVEPSESESEKVERYTEGMPEANNETTPEDEQSAEEAAESMPGEEEPIDDTVKDNSAFSPFPITINQGVNNDSRR